MECRHLDYTGTAMRLIRRLSTWKEVNVHLQLEGHLRVRTC